MTVDDSNERPLGLRELAQTESPELVHAALSRFRRRLFARAMIFVLIAAVAVILYPRYTRRPIDISDEIQRGHGVALFHTIKAGDLDVSINRVARISPQGLAVRGEVQRFGIYLVVSRIQGQAADPRKPERLVPLLEADPDRGVLTYETRSGSYLDGFEMWIPLVAGTRTIDIPIARVAEQKGSVRLSSSSPTIVHVDMQALPIPAWTWR